MSVKGKWLTGSLFFSLASAGQSNGNGFFDYSSAGIQYYSGATIGKTYKRIKDSRPYATEIYYQRQINVSPLWNRAQRLPQWGVGLSDTHSGSQYVGTIV